MRRVPERHQRRTIAAFVGAMALAAPAFAQSATVTATHDHPTGFVEPGVTVRISFSTTWTGAAQLARVVGDAVAAPDVGIAANNGGVGGGPLVHHGAPVLGSVRGVDVGSGPPAFGPGTPNPFFFHQPVVFLFYDWTAPQSPGVVEFDWVPRPDVPNAMFYMTPLSVSHDPLPTTYIGTSLTVVPAPGAAALALAAGVLACGRRRRV